MISGTQLRMLRAAVDESLQVFAEGCGVSHVTISQIEKDDASPSTRTLDKILGYAAKRGYEIREDGSVGPTEGKPRILTGADGFRQFYDELYETARDEGGELCLYNAVSKAVMETLGEDHVKLQQERMETIKDNYTYKVILEESDDIFFGDSYCEYKWFPKKHFNNETFYIFGTKVAFVEFDIEPVRLTIINQAKLANSLRFLYNLAWEHVAQEPKK